MSKNLFFVGIINCFNIATLIYNIMNYNFVFQFTTIQFFIFLAAFVYYFYILIMEIRQKFCSFFISESNSSYVFMRDTYFRYMFYFQSYSTFSWLISFNKAYKYDLKSTDFVEFYSFVLLFLAMMISIYIEDKKHSEDTTTNEIRNILVINLICYLLTFAFTKIPGTSPMEIFMYLVLEYILDNSTMHLNNDFWHILCQ